MKYECKRCFYNTQLKSDMKRHLNRKIKCPRILESYKYNDKDLEELSLTPNKSKENLKTELSNNKILENIKENIKIDSDVKNINNFDDILKYIKDNKCKKCFYCNLEFSRYYDLIRHIKENCKMFNINSEKVYDSKNYIQNNITNNILNQQNNITINVYSNKSDITLIPFDQNWEVNKIDEKKKLILLLDNMKYSKTMEELLQNEKNQNIIFDKETNLGLVYKNHIEKFINIDTKDIIDKSMYKIYEHLINFYNEVKEDGYILSELDIHKKVIETKYEDYINNKKTQDIVKDILVDIFDKNKDKVIERFIQFNVNDNIGDKDNNKVGY